MIPHSKIWFLVISLVMVSWTDKQSIPQKLIITISDHVTILPGKDSVFLNPVYFNTDKKDNFYYSCLLKTPVCKDTLCQFVQIKIFWGLIGNYIKFDTLVGYPLTKNDHQPFTTADYERLQNTLSDKNSVLGRTSEHELVDKTKTRYSEKIDGFTGATSLQIKNSVVDGALYSSYSLWHLVNGSIREKLRDYTIDNYNDDIEYQLLGSGYPNMMIIALKQWSDQDYQNRFDEVITIMKQGNPLVNFYISKNLPTNVFVNEKNKKSIEKIWDQLDPNTKSILADLIKLEW